MASKKILKTRGNIMKSLNNLLSDYNLPEAKTVGAVSVSAKFVKGEIAAKHDNCIR